MSEQNQNNSNSEPDDQTTLIDGQHFRRVPTGHGVAWLVQAYYFFKLNPKVWLGCILAMMFIMLFISLTQILTPVIQILAPVFTAGLMYGNQQLKNNQEFNFNHLFKGFNFQFNKLALIGLIYLGCALLSYMISELIINYLGYPVVEITPEMLKAGGIDTETMQAYIISMSLLSLFMMALMLPVFMAYWFAPALIILRKCEPIDALKRSFYACTLNMKAFLIYGLAAMAAIIVIGLILVLLWTIIPALSMLLLLFSTLALTCIFYASMFTSFDDIFLLESEQNIDSEKERNIFDNDNSDKNNASDDNNDGPTSITL
mgnify:CR=1 FL=1